MAAAAAACASCARRRAAGLESASSEALTAFGDGSVFIERYVESPRHIEIQILADGESTVHLFERDCSVQRRHQKVVEAAPAIGLPEDVTQALYADAVRITAGAGYVNAGTVEFLVDPKTWNHYFIEVNPRIQVEHTVTEVITGVDLVQSQMRIAAGQRLSEIGLAQEAISKRGYAIQARVTTEDPALDFRPDTGRLQVWRPAEGFGIRLDGGNAYPGATISPHYDSMLMKVTASALSFQGAADKLSRALTETRIRGVKTNSPFIQNVLRHPDFRRARRRRPSSPTRRSSSTSVERQNRGQKLLNYLGDLVVNGRSVAGAAGGVTPRVRPSSPRRRRPAAARAQAGARGGRADGLRQGGARAARAAAHRHDVARRAPSLLATRVRSRTSSPPRRTRRPRSPVLLIENWGGATFDVCLRFLRECPWERLQMMREAVPNVPFQMLLRGANGVGYTNYPDNAVHKFCDVAVRNGMDVFRVFDSAQLPRQPQARRRRGRRGGRRRRGGDLVHGRHLRPVQGQVHPRLLPRARAAARRRRHPRPLHQGHGGPVKPAAATRLISALRQEFPSLPLHVHTHDTAGTGVASMLACAAAGADAVDAAIDSMSGMTSQPSMARSSPRCRTTSCRRASRWRS